MIIPEITNENWVNMKSITHVNGKFYTLVNSAEAHYVNYQSRLSK